MTSDGDSDVRAALSLAQKKVDDALAAVPIPPSLSLKSRIFFWALIAIALLAAIKWL